MRLRLSLRAARAVIAATAVLTVISIQPSHALGATAQPLAPVTDADGRLGLCDVLPGASPSGIPWAQLAYDAGARINRWEFRWDRIEPRRGTWNFSADDPAVASSLSAGLSVEGILIGTPKWGTAAGQKPGNGVPRGLYLPASNPKNLWAGYVRATVAHYRSQVKWWEVWNEPDLAFFWMGTPVDYFRLLRVSYTVIRQTDPGAHVILAGMVDPGMSFLRQVLDLATGAQAAGGSRSFDIAAWHAYGPAALAYTNLKRIRTILAAHGFGSVPVWVTEDGFPASNPSGEMRQAAYVIQSIAFAFAAGAAKVLVYRASDDPLPKQWGLMTKQGAPRQGYVAFQVAAHYLSHVQAVTHDPTAQVERFVFYEQSRRVTLVWNRGQQDVMTSIPEAQPQATLVDWMGVQSSPQAAGSSIQVTAPGAAYNRQADPRNTVVGGAPVLEIESNPVDDGLSQQVYVPPIPGGQRQIALFNFGATPTTYQVEAADHPRHRIAGLLGPNQAGVVDLGLLAGQTYPGAYILQSRDALAHEAVSTSTATQGASPSTSWFVVGSPRAIAIRNLGSASATVALSAYRGIGTMIASRTVSVAAGSVIQWVVPSSPGVHDVSVAARASGPVIVSGAGPTPAAQPAPQASWYFLRPGGANIRVFNPGKKSAHVSVRFVGPSALVAMQIRLAPLHSFDVPTGAATATLIEATQSVVAGPIAGAVATAAPVAAPSGGAVLAVAGKATHVELLDTTSQPAHVDLAVTSGTTVTHKTILVQPSKLYSVQARQASAPPGGVTVTSDQPVATSVR